jgi:hypothetical protein
MRSSSSSPVPAMAAATSTAGGVVALSTPPTTTSSTRRPSSSRSLSRPPPTSSTSPLRNQTEPEIRAPLCNTLASTPAGCTKSWPSCSASQACVPPGAGRITPASPPPIASGKLRCADDAIAQRLAQDQVGAQMGLATDHERRRLAAGQQHELAAHVAVTGAHTDDGIPSRQQFHVLALEGPEAPDAIDRDFGQVVGSERDTQRRLRIRDEALHGRHLPRKNGSRRSDTLRALHGRARLTANLGRKEPLGALQVSTQLAVEHRARLGAFDALLCSEQVAIDFECLAIFGQRDRPAFGPLGLPGCSEMVSIVRSPSARSTCASHRRPGAPSCARALEVAAARSCA